MSWGAARAGSVPHAEAQTVPVAVPSVLGYDVYRSAQGEPPLEVSPYADVPFTTDLDGSFPILLIINQDSPNPFGIYLGSG